MGVMAFTPTYPPPKPKVKAVVNFAVGYETPPPMSMNFAPEWFFRTEAIWWREQNGVYFRARYPR